MSGPGVGKSTTAAGLFFLMKTANMNVELISEFAKQLVWQERKATFQDQLYIFAKQNHKQQILNGKVSHVITDSPLLLSQIYAPSKYFINFRPIVMEVFNSYDNLNVFINRVKKYNPVGRNQNESEARKVDKEVKAFLRFYEIPFLEIDGDVDAPKEIFEYLKEIRQ